MRAVISRKSPRHIAFLRTTEPLFRTYEPSDHRSFTTESCQCRCRTYEPSDSRTFGMKNLLFRTYEPSDYRTFGLESSHPLIWIVMSDLALFSNLTINKRTDRRPARSQKWLPAGSMMFFSCGQSHGAHSHSIILMLESIIWFGVWWIII